MSPDHLGGRKHTEILFYNTQRRHLALAPLQGQHLVAIIITIIIIIIIIIIILQD